MVSEVEVTVRKVVYIAGPMRGVPYFNFPAFDAAAGYLRGQGYEVVSPADMDREAGFDACLLPEDSDWSAIPDGFDFLAAIDRDIDAVKRCDCVYVLPGWESSKGATAERALAEWMGKEIRYAEHDLTGPAWVLLDRELVRVHAGNHHRWLGKPVWVLPEGETEGSHEEWILVDGSFGQLTVRRGQRFRSVDFAVVRRQEAVPPKSVAPACSVLPDSGARSQFSTGAVRDASTGKGYFALIPPCALRAIARRFEDGATKYGRDNWQKGIPLSRYIDSLLRHTLAAMEGDASEDHYGAILWNAACWLWTEEAIKSGKLPSELNDLTYRR